jgi:hypothetical protein
VVRAKLPPLAFSIHSSFILANHLDPQSRTKADDEDEEEDWDMALNRYRALAWAKLSWPFGP